MALNPLLFLAFFQKRNKRFSVSVTLTISAMPFLGGVRAVIPEKNILIDNSFETLLNEERENFIFHGGVEHE